MVEEGGIYYHARGMTKAQGDPLDKTGMPDIVAGVIAGSAFKPTASPPDATAQQPGGPLPRRGGLGGGAVAPQDRRLGSDSQCSNKGAGGQESLVAKAKQKAQGNSCAF